MATSSFFVTIPNINSNYDSAYISKEPISASHSSGSSTPLGSQQPTQLLYIPPTILKKNAELIFFSQYKNRLSFYTMLAIWTLLCAFFASYYYLPIALICIVGRFNLNRICLYISTALSLSFDVLVITMMILGKYDILGIEKGSQFIFIFIFFSACSLFSIFVTVEWARIGKTDFDYFRTIALGLKQTLPGTFYTKNMKVDKKLLDSMEKKVTIQDSKDPAHSQEIEVYVPESSGSVADSAANSSQQPLLK